MEMKHTVQTSLSKKLLVSWKRLEKDLRKRKVCRKKLTKKTRWDENDVLPSCSFFFKLLVLKFFQYLVNSNNLSITWIYLMYQCTWCYIKRTMRPYSCSLEFAVRSHHSNVNGVISALCMFSSRFIVPLFLWRTMI